MKHRRYYADRITVFDVVYGDRPLKKYLMIVMVLALAMSGIASAEVSSSDLKYPDLPEERMQLIPYDDVLKNVTARSAVVIEASTGTVIYERNMRERRYPASTTKIMTLILALERGNPDDIVTISSNAAGTDGSTLWLEAGEQVRLGDLMYGMMLVSGNDAAVAIAEHIGGSVENFADMMTRKAHEIGATDTYFVNSNGLPDERHCTTAYDLALIAAYGYKDPRFAEIVSSREYILPWKKNADDRKIRNENLLLTIYRGANGVKTGYTDAAGRCLVSGANRNGVQLVSVVLDSLYMWNDSITMLDYGFAHVYARKIAEKGRTMGYVRVLDGCKRRVAAETADDVIVPVFDEDEHIKTEVHLLDTAHANVNKGDVLGKLLILSDGKTVASVDLVAAETVEGKSFFRTVGHALQRIMDWIF